MTIPFAHREAWILKTTAASSLVWGECVQTLWSGYGEIRRVYLEAALEGAHVAWPHTSLILKAIAPPEAVKHPRGWHSDLSHQRKLRSYRVEANWYREWAANCPDNARVAKCYGLDAVQNDSAAEGPLILLEDLDAAGFSKRYEQLDDDKAVFACLKWLAAFHGHFMQCSPEGLWPLGTYWHLDTRPDEWQAMSDSALKEAANAIDQRLKQGQFQTLVHGDAKVANFCFHENNTSVAAVDFQYVGGGCGMKDIAYFLGSCLSESRLSQREEAYLDYYFEALRSALPETVNANDLEQEWRALYAFAWADFHRFLLGWMPNHPKINSMMQCWTERALVGL